MDGQLSLFEPDILPAVNGKKDRVPLKCNRVLFQESVYMDTEGMFSGFDEMRVITFSYDLDFIEKIMGFFSYAEIILGADFLVENDRQMTSLLSNAYGAAESVRAHPVLAGRLKDGDAVFRTPLSSIDHRKVFLLMADDGRTRTVIGSANMSAGAWNGSHMENYCFDDSRAGYDAYMEDFRTAWELSEEIPYSVVACKKTDDIVKGNPILSKVKKTDKAIVLQQKMPPEIVKYVIDHKKIGERYDKLLKGADRKTKGGLCEISPKTVQKMESTQRGLKEAPVREEGYPSIEIDCGAVTMAVNGVPQDLHPKEADIRSDLDTLLGAFRNFDDFIDTANLKENHFKLLTLLLASPFIAGLRCHAYVHGADCTSLPLYTLISGKANGGKSFTIQLALKMMTGITLEGTNKKDCNKEKLQMAQMAVKGTPFFVDELDGHFLAVIRDMIKNPDSCERNGRSLQPMSVFASNDVTDPEEALRKRMVFIRISGELPSNIDKSAYATKKAVILQDMGTAFYREYVRRMCGKISAFMDMLSLPAKERGQWYPDLPEASSSVIISIMDDLGYDVPPYIRPLHWDRDYFGSTAISRDSIRAIADEYSINSKAFTVSAGRISIRFGNDKDGKRKLESWKNTLPADMGAVLSSTKETVTLTLDRLALEEASGIHFGKGILKRFRL